MGLYRLVEVVKACLNPYWCILLCCRIGGILLYIGQSKFLSTASDVSNNLVTKANTIVDVVHDVLSNLGAAKNIKVGQFDLPDDIKKNIGKIERLSNQTAYVYIKRQSEETAESSTQFLNAMWVNPIL